MIKDSQMFSPFTEQPIQLLDDAGNWIAPFELDLSKEQLLSMYQDLLSARLLDERLGRLQRRGRISFVAPTSGHEGAQVGVAHAVRAKHDWLFPYYRDTGMLLALGVPAVEIFGQNMATQADPNKARQMPSHVGSKDFNVFTIASAIASHIPPAVGAALSMKLQNTGQVAVTSFGDGATSEGDFHAAINFAGAQGAPVVFVCENNRYAISVDFRKQSASETVVEKAHAYGMPGYLVDGMDVLACYYVMKDVVERARAGFGPSLVEMFVYRYGPHSSADDDSRYRPKEEVDAWKQRDPIKRLKTFLIKQNYLTNEQNDALIAQCDETLAQAVKVSEAAGSAPVSWMFEDVYAELPQHLKDQAELLN